MGYRAIRRQPNGRYRVNYYYWDQNGAKCRARKKFRTLHLAEAFHAERLREFEAKIRAGTRERVLLTVSQFLGAHYIPWASRAKRSWPTEKIFLKNVAARWGERRLSSISRVAMNGVDMDERMALMGHKTITAACIYTHFYTKKLSESVERLMNAYRAAAEEAKGHKKGTEAIAV